jgi:hypothetical protein
MKLGYSILPWQSLPGLSQSEAIARGCHDIRAAGFNAVEVLLASTLGSTVLLVYDLLSDSPLTSEAGPLLLAGALISLPV